MKIKGVRVGVGIVVGVTGLGLLFDCATFDGGSGWVGVRAEVVKVGVLGWSVWVGVGVGVGIWIGFELENKQKRPHI